MIEALQPRATERAAGTERQLALGDLFLCLARAFLPPPAELSASAWCDALADDLELLACELRLDATAVAGVLRAHGASPGAAEPWLVDYSRLFLVPPAVVPLNTGIYLEGGLGGASGQMLAECYAAAGFARREDFRDLPDHVAIQLEFLAALLQRAGGGDADAQAMAVEFGDSFARQWIDPLRLACERAADRFAAARVYAALVAFLRPTLDSLG